MKGKKILVAVVFVLLVVVYFLVSVSSCGTKDEQPVEPTQETVTPVTEMPAPEATDAAAEPAPTAEASTPETQPTEAPAEPVVLEDGGELEIIIPDDMDSDGF